MRKITEEDVYRLADGQADAAEAGEIKAALAMDPELAQLYQSLLLLQEGLHGLGAMQPDDQYSRELVYALQQQVKRRKRSSFRSLFFGPLGLSLLLITMLASLLFSLEPSGVSQLPGSTALNQSMEQVQQLITPMQQMVFSWAGLSLPALALLGIVLLLLIDRLVLKRAFGLR